MDLFSPTYDCCFDKGLFAQCAGLTTNDASHSQPLDRTNRHKDQENALLIKGDRQNDDHHCKRQRIDCIHNTHHECFGSATTIASKGAIANADNQCNKRGGKTNSDRDLTTDQDAHHQITAEIICTEPVLA